MFKSGIYAAILLNLPVNGVAAEEWIVFLLLHFFGLQFFVTGGHVSGGRFTFLACFSTFNGDDFAWHDV